ncbi:MAG: hypothetical protein ACREE9_01195 [Stellaceae bacterium]
MQPFSHRPLDDVDEIAYRQQIMQDLDCPTLLDQAVSVAGRMREVRSLLRASEQGSYRLHRNSWLLDAAATYCGAVRQLSASLTEIELRSLGFQRFREYLSGYIASEAFTSFVADTEKVTADLGSVKYSMLIRDLAITVHEYQNGGLCLCFG